MLHFTKSYSYTLVLFCILYLGSMAADAANLSDIAAIAAGGAHTCAVSKAGAVKCWGNNSFGQLGDNSTSIRLTPANVTGLTTGVKAIAAGWGHTCALTTSGGVKCWGNNDHGQLGDSFLSNRRTPFDVTGLTSGVKAIAAGTSHTCALTTSGGVKCWGQGSFGQIGDNSFMDHTAPQSVTGLASGVTAIAVGYIILARLPRQAGSSAGGITAMARLEIIPPLIAWRQLM